MSLSPAPALAAQVAHSDSDSDSAPGLVCLRQLWACNAPEAAMCSGSLGHNSAYNGSCGEMLASDLMAAFIQYLYWRLDKTVWWYAVSVSELRDFWLDDCLCLTLGAVQSSTEQYSVVPVAGLASAGSGLSDWRGSAVARLSWGHWTESLALASSGAVSGGVAVPPSPPSR